MPAMKADRDWIEDFRLAYDHWLGEAMPLLEQEDYQAAFRFYPFPEFETAPWTPVTKPLADSRLAMTYGVANLIAGPVMIVLSWTTPQVSRVYAASVAVLALPAVFWFCWWAWPPGCRRRLWL